MGDRTKIEWTDASWTPIRARLINRDAAIAKPVGAIGWHCSHVSEGCRNCYAEKINERLGTGLSFKPGHRIDVELFLDEAMLLKPLRWKKPRRIFVCSMTDLFADFVKDEWIDRIFAVMALCPQHTFQVLTKRPERMREYMLSRDVELRTARASVRIERLSLGSDVDLEIQIDATEGWDVWPRPNIWLGTSCEDQATADERIPHLLATPAAIRFLSCEPLLGPIDLTDVANNGDATYDVLRDCPDEEAIDEQGWKGIDWVICGGESGPHARPMHPDWARSLLDQCAAAGVPFFFKQWGEWGLDDGPKTEAGDPVWEGKARCAWFDGAAWHIEDNGYVVDLKESEGSGQWVYRLGKSSAGRKLDGIEHNAFPEVRT